MTYNITHTFSPVSRPRTVATTTDLTAEAVEAALAKIPAHAAKVLIFELDADNPGCADAFTDRGEVYAIENN